MINAFHSFGLSIAHMIPPTIIRMKHTTNVNDITTFVNTHINLGNAPVASPLSIQSQITGKHVFNLTQLHSHPQFAAST